MVQTRQAFRQSVVKLRKTHEQIQNMTKGIFTEAERTGTFKASVSFERKTNAPPVNSDLMFHSSKTREFENKSASLNKNAEQEQSGSKSAQVLVGRNK